MLPKLPKFGETYKFYMALMNMPNSRTMPPKDYGIMLQGKKRKKKKGGTK